MDPTRTLINLLHNMALLGHGTLTPDEEQEARHYIQECLESLLAWIAKGGFCPKVQSFPELTTTDAAVFHILKQGPKKTQ